MKSELKIGDKLYCKKNLIDYIDYDFVAGNFYKIIKIEHSPAKYTLYIFEPLYFSSGGQVRDILIWNYFCTQKELRKLKLEKINEKVL